MSTSRLLFKLRDLWVILAVACAALLCFLLIPGEGAASTAVITSMGDPVAEMPLDRDDSKQISSGGYTLTVTVSSGKVAVTGSDCPGQICVKTGAISSPGASIICVPAGVAVTVSGGTLDGVTY